MDPRRITCVKCGGPVVETEWWDDYVTGDRVLRVYCHGEIDEMRLQLHRISWVEMDVLKSAQGIAFAFRPSLPADTQG